MSPDMGATERDPNRFLFNSLKSYLPSLEPMYGYILYFGSSGAAIAFHGYEITQLHIYMFQLMFI